jgi:hypothetical protein
MSAIVVSRFWMVSGRTPELAIAWPSSVMVLPKRAALPSPVVAAYREVANRASLLSAAVANRAGMSLKAPRESLMSASQEMSNCRPYFFTA